MPLAIKRTSLVTAAANSVQFNGSSQYLKLPSNSSAWTLNGDFTIECWFNTTTTNQNGIFTMNWSGDWNAVYGNGFSLCTNYVITPQGNTTWSAPSINIWHHIAVVRSGAALSTYLDGVNVGSQTNSNQFGNATTTPGIGLFDTYGGTIRSPFPGYISNLRILKGTALYTSNFTPPTSSLTAITNTSLLTCNVPTIVDGSSNNFTITNNGAATVSSITPFTPALKGLTFKNRFNNGTTTPTSNSVLFNGSNQYLSIPYNSNLWLGSSNWTIECWVYLNSLSTYNVIWDHGYGAPNTIRSIVVYMETTTGLLRIAQTSDGSTNYDTSLGITLTTNSWKHVAIVRNGANVTAYLNGTAGTSVTAYNLYNSTTRSHNIGIQGDLQSITAYNGYISNHRVVKGTAVYTSNFTPSTAPLTAISGTSLLTCNAATIVDSSTNNFTITNNGAATVSSTVPFTASFAPAPSTMKIKKVNADPATLVTNGLVLNLDASNASSYPGTGTTWTDLSGNGNTGTLTNGPTFNSANGGSIVFDGSNDYISIGSQNVVGTGTSAFTGELWWYINKTLASGEYILPIRIKQDSEFFIALYNPSGTYNLYGTFRGYAQYGIPVTNSDYINKWICMQFVYTGGNKNSASSYKFYINGAQIAVGSNSFGPAGGENSNCNIIGSDGNNGCNVFFTSGLMKGNIASYRLYTGELTAAQLLQNYNANRAKFGL